MGKRVVLAGILGGVGMFVWSSVAHMVLPFGMIGISQIPNEQGVLTAMNATLGEKSGLYMFPGFGSGGSADMKEYEKKLATTPNGLLVYHPPGGKPMTPGQLIAEFVTELIEACLAVFLLSLT